MPHATVLLMLDATRADAVRPDTMPFLHGLAREGVSGSLESPPGFALRTVLFSGRYPDTSGNFSQFVFDPRRSPFRWVRLLGPARGLVQPRRALYPLRRAIEAVSKWNSLAYQADPAWIPPRFLPSFAPCEDLRPVHEPGALGAPSLFDLCRRAGLRFRYLARPAAGDDEATQQTLVRELREKRPVDLYVAQFSAAAEHGQKEGPFSDAMRKEHLPVLDQRIATIHAALAATYESWDLVICADHGMAPIEREVDVLSHLERVDAKPGKDYVVFVNSTLAVFWYLTERGRRAVERSLPGVPGTHVVTEAERRRRRIPVERRWGDRMLAAEPGVLFWPDYFHVEDSTVNGMHGYLDKREESYGIACVVSSPGRTPVKNVGLRPLVDVFPTLCDLLRLPVPSSNEGASLLRTPLMTAQPPSAAPMAAPAPPTAPNGPPAVPAGAPPLPPTPPVT